MPHKVPDKCHRVSGCTVFCTTNAVKRNGAMLSQSAFCTVECMWTFRQECMTVITWFEMPWGFFECWSSRFVDICENGSLPLLSLASLLNGVGLDLWKVRPSLIRSCHYVKKTKACLMLWFLLTIFSMIFNSFYTKLMCHTTLCCPHDDCASLHS